MKKTIILYLSFFLILVYSCRQDPKLNIEGKWQSLNAPTVVEFFKNKQIDSFNHGEPFWSQTANSGILTFKIEPIEKDWYSMTIFDGEEIFIIGKIEKVLEDRIRIYYYKHHGILDLADEYQKTEDYSSFKSIMGKILEEPDTIYFTKK